MSHDVVVVGAGLAGLACAVHLAEAGVAPLVLEAADGIGGRVRTDEVGGFRLDRGFQIYLTAYPEGRRLLDYDALDLREFQPGALVRHGGDFHRLGDPLRRPGDLAATLRAPVGTLSDKVRTAWMARLRFAGPGRLQSGADVTTAEDLRRRGFSANMIDRFWRPLFAGIQLAPDLDAPARVARFVFGMLGAGAAVVPAAGMQAIPDQLAGRLPGGTIRTGAAVAAVAADAVTLDGGETVAGGAVVVATDGPAAAGLAGIPDPGSRPVSCVYFAAPEPPIGAPVLVLDGEGTGPVNNLAVMSNVAPEYAPPGQALVAAACVPGGGADLADRARIQLREWFGDGVDAWEHLRTYHIPHAQPAVRPPFSPSSPARLDSGVFVAGDHRATPSINGALASGRRAAEAILTGR